MSDRKSFIEGLISAVQSRPILWQSNQKDYKNKNVTDKLWDEVGKETKPICTGEFIYFIYIIILLSYKTYKYNVVQWTDITYIYKCNVVQWTDIIT